MYSLFSPTILKNLMDAGFKYIITEPISAKEVDHMAAYGHFLVIPSYLPVNDSSLLDIGSPEAIDMANGEIDLIFHWIKL